MLLLGNYYNINMGLPGFEPGSQGPKPRILNRAILQPHEKE